MSARTTKEGEMLLFDLDNTLLRTGMLTRLALADLAVATGRSVEDLYAIADKMEWGYTFPGLLGAIGCVGSEHDEHLKRYHTLMRREARGCLYPGAITLVNAFAATTNVGLVTRGVEEHQRGKFACLTELHRAIPEHRRHFVTPEQGKGGVVASLLEASEREVVMVDDNPNDLINIFERAPRTTLVRMAWPDRWFAPSPDDGKKWQVATGMCSLVRILRECV